MDVNFVKMMDEQHNVYYIYAPASDLELFFYCL